MSTSTNFDVESDVLAVRYLDGSASPEEVERLDALLVADPARREWFATLCIVVTGLGEVSAAPSPPQGDAESPEINIPPPINTPSLFGDAYHGTMGFFSQEVPLAWLITTVVMGMLLLGAWAIKVTHYQHIAEAPSQSVPSDVRQEMVFVGRITGMVDVKWSDDPHYLPPPGFAHVPLGRKYILSSGLLEITYDSGAKVILQGPCTYEVESTASGYLALGKLTARIGERGEGRGESAKPQAANQKSPSSFILHPSSLFSVRTPTAVVTDLGTEFGVEVGEEGRTKTQVFVGKVRLASTSPSGKANEGQVLSAGQTGVVQSGNAAVVVADAAEAMRFVRVMPSPKRVCRGDEYAALVLSLRPVVYYRMERPEKVEEDRLALFDSSPGGRHGTLHWDFRYGRPWLWGQRGRFDGALYLRGPDCHDYAIVSELPDGKTNQLSFSAWVRAEAGTTDLCGRIACEGDWNAPDRPCRFTIGLQYQGDGDLEALLDQADGKRIQVREGRSTPFPMGQWQHVALVADESVLRLYRNGVEVGSSPSNGVIAALDGDYLTIGCANVWSKDRGFRPGAFWGGWIDELAVFRRALRREEIRRLFEGLVVPGKEGAPMNGP